MNRHQRSNDKGFGLAAGPDAVGCAERWFVAAYNEALPLVKDPKLAEDMRGFIGQESTHADVHDRVLHDYMVTHAVDVKPLLDQIEYVFANVLAPSPSLTDPRRRLNHSGVF